MTTKDWARRWFSVLTLAFPVVAFGYGLWAYSSVSPRTSWFERVWAILSDFLGSNITFEAAGADGHVPTRLTIALVLCISATLLAALAAALVITRELRDDVLGLRSGQLHTVIGSDRSAAEVLRNIDSLDLPRLRWWTLRTRHPVRLLTGSKTGDAAVVAQTRGIPMTLIDVIDQTHDFAQIASLVRDAAHVIVATQDDAFNRLVARELGKANAPERKVVAVLSDAELADEMRPAILRDMIPSGPVLSSPAENLAERVTLLIHDVVVDRLKAAQGPLEPLTVALDGDHGVRERALRLWLTRLSAALVHLGLPPLTLEDPSPDSERVIVIVVGDDATEVAIRARRANRMASPRVQMVVSLAKRELVAADIDDVVPRHEIRTLDPDETGWNAALLFDDIHEQWARSFHYAYRVCFDDHRPWEAPLDAPWTGIGGVKQASNRRAAANMLRFLWEAGYRLLKVGDDVAVDVWGEPYAPCWCFIESIARREHEDWLTRVFVIDLASPEEHGGLFYPPTGMAKFRDGNAPEAEGAHQRSMWQVRETSRWDPETGKYVSRRQYEFDRPWDELSGVAKAANHWLVGRSYPALAAMFGYEIRRDPTAEQTPRQFRCADECGGAPWRPPLRQATFQRLAESPWFRSTAVINAHQLSEPRSWETERGSTLVAAAGDWLLSDSSGEWTVRGDIFARTYAAVDSEGTYRKRSLVQAIKVFEDGEVPTLEGSATLCAGDWLVKNDSGEVWPIPSTEFGNRYHGADERVAGG